MCTTDIITTKYYKYACVIYIQLYSPYEIASLKLVFETTLLPSFRSFVGSRWTVALGAQSITDGGWVFRGQGRQVSWFDAAVLLYTGNHQMAAFVWFGGFSWRSELARFGPRSLHPLGFWGYTVHFEIAGEVYTSSHVYVQVSKEV